MSYSDYLSLKKKKNIYKDNRDTSGSFHTQKRHVKQLQHTVLINEDNEVIPTNRFIKDISFKSKTTKNAQMYSIPRIHVAEYIKNRYQPPFCWTCVTPLNEILYNISCSVCDSLIELPSEIDNNTCNITPIHYSYNTNNATTVQYYGNL